ncbi:MAG: hypothetical protein LBT69_05700 [Lactobacillales bacterium]|jgi:hypothetical protein|nr:hypothetical protein [Lactobacillales bacterium]
MKTKELIEQNNQLREQLTPENNTYYEEMLIYIRTGSFFRDEKESESILLEILQDILLAQKNGESATDYFGKNPKEIADEILVTLTPKKLSKENIALFFEILGITGFYVFVFSTKGPFNLLEVLVNTLITIFVIALIFRLIHQTSFKKRSFIQKNLPAILIFISLVLLFVVSHLFVPKIWIITLPSLVRFNVMLTLCLLYTGGLILLNKRKIDFSGAILIIYIWKNLIKAGILTFVSEKSLQKTLMVSLNILFIFVSIAIVVFAFKHYNQLKKTKNF